MQARDDMKSVSHLTGARQAGQIWRLVQQGCHHNELLALPASACICFCNAARSSGDASRPSCNQRGQIRLHNSCLYGSKVAVQSHKRCMWHARVAVTPLGMRASSAWDSGLPYLDPKRHLPGHTVQERCPMGAHRRCACHAEPRWLACVAGRRSSLHPLSLQPQSGMLNGNTAEVGSNLSSDGPTWDVQHIRSWGV